MANNVLNKQLLKKWWFWVIVVVVLGLIGLATGSDDTNTTTGNTVNTSTQAIKYTIIGETLGKYGKEVTLNQNSDMPVKKYLYKLPAGTYKATTTFDKMASFFIVKDEIGLETNNNDYPETLNYVGEAHLLTAGDNDFNGKAKKEVTVTLGEDESISVVSTNQFTFEKL